MASNPHVVEEDDQPSRHSAQVLTPQRPPRTWLMVGHKDGDNAQVQGLGEALGWPFEIKRFVYRPTELLTNLLGGPNLAGIDRRRSSPLEPPWPELIISSGRRNEPVCRWIQRRAAKESGVHTRLVHVGRSWAKPSCFDLIVTTPQYRVPKGPNVLQNATPLHRVSQERLAEEAAEWAPRLAHLPEPYILLALGGRAGPYDFDEDAARLLADWASRMAADAGGSVLVTTSRRTPARSVVALKGAITAPSYIYEWSKTARTGEGNPYFGMLALAHSIIVTCDSMSMLAEACFTQKPVYIFDLDDTATSHRPPWLEGMTPPKGRSWRRRLSEFRLQPLVYRIAMVTGPQRLTRDVRIIHHLLIQSGRAAWLGEPFVGVPKGPADLTDIERAVSRVQALFTPVMVPEDPRSPEALEGDQGDNSDDPTPMNAAS